MTNRLYYGDNLQVLREHVDSESVDLVYLDPPFRRAKAEARGDGAAGEVVVKRAIDEAIDHLASLADGALPFLTYVEESPSRRLDGGALQLGYPVYTAEFEHIWAAFRDAGFDPDAKLNYVDWQKGRTTLDDPDAIARSTRRTCATKSYASGAGSASAMGIGWTCCAAARSSPRCVAPAICRMNNSQICAAPRQSRVVGRVGRTHRPAWHRAARLSCA